MQQRISFGFVGVCAILWLFIPQSVNAQADNGKQSPSTLTAIKADNSVVVEAKGGALTYKVTVDPKSGGNITQLCLPADSKPVARELNDIFFLGQHGEEFTLRGWTGKDKFTISSNVECSEFTSTCCSIAGKNPAKVTRME